MLVFLLIFGLAQASAKPAAAASGFVTVSGTNYVLNGQTIRLRGINMNNEQALGAAIGSANIADINVGAADYARIAGWGLNLVRFGLSFNWYQANRTQFFQVMDLQVAAAKTSGVYLIPLMFTTPGNCYEGYSRSCAFWGSASEQQQLSNFWKDFAQHYASETGIIAYDLLNEPMPSGGKAQWFSIAQSMRDAITSVDPNHYVVIEAGSDSLFQSTLGPRVIYSVHGYAPLSMTTGASPGRYSYPGWAPDWDGTNRYWSYQAMTDPSTAVYMGARLSFDWGASHGVPMFYGEFGTQPFGTGWTQYESDQTDLAERWGVAWTIFVYREFSYSDFGIYYGPSAKPVGDPAVAVKQAVVDMLVSKYAAPVPPPAPTSVRACGGDGYAAVTWTPPASGVDAYTVTAAPGGQSVSAGARSVAATVPGLTRGTAYSFTVTARNAAGLSTDSSPSNSVSPAPLAGFPGQLHPLPPARILDTRTGLGGSTVGAGQTLNLDVLRQGGVPATGVAAVLLSLTVTGAKANGFVTAYAAGACRPFVSNLNYGAGQTIPNLVVVAVGQNGRVSLYNSSTGPAELVADVEGWIATSPAAGGAGRLHSLAPARIIDTRIGQGLTTLGPGQTATLPLGGLGGLPTSGVGAVAVNLTVTNPRTHGFLTAFPAGTTAPLASNANFGGGQTIAVRAVVPTGASEALSFYNGSTGATDLVVDVNGWFSDAGGVASNGVFTGVTPVRLVDTRDGTGGVQGSVAAGATIAVSVAGGAGVPAGAAAVAVNVTAINVLAPHGYVTVFPNGLGRPLASDVNFARGQAIPNLVIVQVGPDGKVALFNGAPSGPVDLVVDLVGWYS